MSNSTFDEELEQRRQRRKEDARRMQGWLIAAGLIVGVVAFFTAFASQTSGASIAEKIGYDIGSSTARGLVIAGATSLVLWLAAGQRLAPGNAGRHFGILFLIALGAAAPALMVGLFGAGQSATAQRGLEQTIADLRQREATISARAVAAREKFEQSEVLTPEALARPGGVERAKTALWELREATNVALADARTLQADARVQIHNNLSSARDREEYDRGVAETHASSQAAIRLANENLNLMQAQLDILSKTPRRWRVQNDLFEFERQADLEAFNTIAIRQQEIQREMAQLQTSQRP